MGAALAWLMGALLIFAVVPFTLLVIKPTNQKLRDPAIDRSSAAVHRLRNTGEDFMPFAAFSLWRPRSSFSLRSCLRHQRRDVWRTNLLGRGSCEGSFEDISCAQAPTELQGIFIPNMRRPPNFQLLGFLEAYDRPIADLVLALREIILEEVPDASESTYQVYTVAIWFGLSGKMKDMFCYIATNARHINLGFPRGSTLPDPNGLLEGDGKAMRDIKFASQLDLERSFVRRYIRASLEQVGEAASTAGAGKSVVKSSGKKTSVKKRSVNRRRASG
jgi:hypothetical protein